MATMNPVRGVFDMIATLERNRVSSVLDAIAGTLESAIRTCPGAPEVRIVAATIGGADDVTVFSMSVSLPRYDVIVRKNVRISGEAIAPGRDDVLDALIEAVRSACGDALRIARRRDERTRTWGFAA